MPALQLGYRLSDGLDPFRCLPPGQRFNVGTKARQERPVDRPAGLMQGPAQRPEFGRRSRKAVDQHRRRPAAGPVKGLMFFALEGLEVDQL